MNFLLFFLNNKSNFPDNRRMSERDMNRVGADGKMPLSAHGQLLPNSKSVPALHHVGNMSKLPQ